MTGVTPPATEGTSQEKKWLLQLCGACIGGLILLGVVSLFHGVDATGATIVGVIVGALGTNAKDLVSAVRSYSMAASLQRVTDQVAAATPIGDAPLPVTVTNTKGDPVPVETKR
jgi:hypothetical protein